MTAPAAARTLAVPGCRCVRISPDGTSLLTISGTAQVWDVGTGLPGWSRSWEAVAGLPIEAVWGAGGESITVLSGAELHLLDAVTGAGRAVPEELAGRRDVTALALSVAGINLAVGTREGVVLLWQQDTGRVTRLRGGGDPVTALAWQPGETELCVARPRSIQFWRMPAATMSSSIPMTDLGPHRLAWAPDGDLLVVLGNNDVRVMNMRSREESAPPLFTRRRPLGLSFSRTGRALLIGRPDGIVELRDRRLEPTGIGRAELPAALVEPAGLHVNETGLVAVRSSAEDVALYVLDDTIPPDVGKQRAVTLRRWAAAVAHRGQLGSAAGEPPVPLAVQTRSGFAWAADGWYQQNHATGELTRHAADGRPRWTVQAGTGPLVASERFVAVGAGPGRTVVLETANGSTVAELPGNGPAAWSGETLVLTDPQGHDLLVYDHSWIARKLSAQDLAGAPALAPDGTILAAATRNDLVLWDRQTLRRTRRVSLGAAARAAALSFSPDGGYLAVDRPGGPVAIWPTETWQRPATAFASGSGGRVGLAWSPDSRLLAIPAPRPIGTVRLWDIRLGRSVYTVPPPPDRARAVTGIDWATEGRFAVRYDDDTVIRWKLTVPRIPEEHALGHPVDLLAALVAGVAARGSTIGLPLLSDLLALLLGQPAGPLGELVGHPGVAMLRGLHWPPAATVGLAVMVAAGLPGDPELPPPDDVTVVELRTAAASALDDGRPLATDYPVPAAELLGELDRIDDSVVMLATLLGPDAVAAEPDLLARVRSESFTGWTVGLQQRRLLGLRSTVSLAGGSQGHGIGAARAGVARHGSLPSLLPSQLALPRLALTAKKLRDELLFRTRQGELPVEAQPVVLLLDDTAAAFGAVGVTLRIVANLLAGLAIRQHRRAALVPLGSSRVTVLAEMADLVHLWGAGSVERPDVKAAMRAAATVAGQLSDPISGLPRLVLLTHPYLPCPSQNGLHVVRVHYPGSPVEDVTPRTHVLSPGAPAERLHEVIGLILAG